MAAFLDSPLLWILLSGVVMSAISLVGAATFFLSDRLLNKILKPLVALSAGSLLGGAFFHLIPESVESYQNSNVVYLWVLGGFSCFFVMEQFLHWHHCHGGMEEHGRHRAPIRTMVLISDALHNFIGGVAVAAAFMVDPRLGWITCLGEALHEVPQELGDFGVLVHAGWSKRRALFFNFLSGLTFIVGGLLTYFASTQLDVGYLLAFAAGNFLYLGAVDLVPEINKHEKILQNFLHFLMFAAGIALLYVMKLHFHE